MPWYGWIVLADIGVSVLYKISLVGKSRTITATEAMFGVVEMGLIAWAVVLLGFRA